MSFTATSGDFEDFVDPDDVDEGESNNLRGLKVGELFFIDRTRVLNFLVSSATLRGSSLVIS